MYRARGYYSTEIERVIVVDETAHYYTVKREPTKWDKNPGTRREKKVVDARETLCLTWEEAHARLIKWAEAHVARAERDLTDAHKVLETCKALQKPKEA